MTRNVPGRSIIDMWEHKGWGNSVGWQDFERRSISGHLPFRVKVGDEVRCKMESGKVARFKVMEHKQCNDPNDMFFATVRDIGYVGEAEFEECMSNDAINIRFLFWHLHIEYDGKFKWGKNTSVTWKQAFKKPVQVFEWKPKEIKRLKGGN